MQKYLFTSRGINVVNKLFENNFLEFHNLADEVFMLFRRRPRRTRFWRKIKGFRAEEPRNPSITRKSAMYANYTCIIILVYLCAFGVPKTEKMRK